MVNLILFGKELVNRIYWRSKNELYFVKNAQGARALEFQQEGVQMKVRECMCGEHVYEWRRPFVRGPHNILIYVSINSLF
jgi:hypothetical protein